MIGREKVKRYARAATLLERARSLAEKARALLDETGEGRFELSSDSVLGKEAKVLREMSKTVAARARG